MQRKLRTYIYTLFDHNGVKVVGFEAAANVISKFYNELLGRQ